MKYAAIPQRDTPSCLVYLVTELSSRASRLICISKDSFEMQRKVGENWRGYSNHDLQLLLKQMMGKAPVSSSLIITMLSSAPSTDAVDTAAALIQFLPESQQSAIQRIAQQRVLEVSKLTAAEMAEAQSEVYYV